MTGHQKPPVVWFRPEAQFAGAAVLFAFLGLGQNIFQSYVDVSSARISSQTHPVTALFVVLLASEIAFLRSTYGRTGGWLLALLVAWISGLFIIAGRAGSFALNDLGPGFSGFVSPATAMLAFAISVTILFSRFRFRHIQVAFAFMIAAVTFAVVELSIGFNVIAAGMSFFSLAAFVNLAAGLIASHTHLPLFRWMRTEPRIMRQGWALVGVALVLPLATTLAENGQSRDMDALATRGFATTALTLACLACVIAVNMLRYRLLQQEAQLRVTQSIANHDVLTGAKTRRAVLDKLREDFAAGLDEKRMTLALADVDGLKQINDEFGHVWGDRVLRECALRFHESLADTALLSRWGGDEFLVLSEIGEGPDVASVFAEVNRQLAKIEELSTVRPSLAMGAVQVVWPMSASDFQLAIAKADVLLYEAKKSGPGRAQFAARIENEVLLPNLPVGVWPNGRGQDSGAFGFAEAGGPGDHPDASEAFDRAKPPKSADSR